MLRSSKKSFWNVRELISSCSHIISTNVKYRSLSRILRDRLNVFIWSMMICFIFVLASAELMYLASTRQQYVLTCYELLTLESGLITLIM